MIDYYACAHDDGDVDIAAAAAVSRKEVVVTEEESQRLMEAMEYLKTGASYREAAKKFGFSTTYLWRRGKEFGLMSRKLGVMKKMKIKKFPMKFKFLKKEKNWKLKSF